MEGPADMFEKYPPDWAAEEAAKLKALVVAGETADYATAEKSVAEVEVDRWLREGMFWRAIRVATQSHIESDDIYEKTFAAIEDRMDEAREANHREEFERLRQELEEIEEWRGF